MIIACVTTGLSGHYEVWQMKFISIVAYCLITEIEGCTISLHSFHSHFPLVAQDFVHICRYTFVKWRGESQIINSGCLDASERVH